MTNIERFDAAMPKLIEHLNADDDNWRIIADASGVSQATIASYRTQAKYGGSDNKLPYTKNTLQLMDYYGIEL